jgi:hypothetical protein
MKVRLYGAAMLLTLGMLTGSPAHALPPNPEPQAPGGVAAAPTVWHVEMVTKGAVGRYNSLQLDDAGWPHIAYYDSGYGDLMYAYKNASGWHFETVDSVGNVGGYASLALDELGQPNISYCQLSTGSSTQCEKLKYAIKLSGEWHNQTIDQAGGPTDKVGAYSSLAVEGGPNYEDMSQHISYYDATNDDLKYCWGTGAFWACEVVDSVGDVGRYGSLALAGSHPRIVYMNYLGDTNGELKYARWNGSNWLIDKVDGPSTDTGAFGSIDLCPRTLLEPARIAYVRNGGLGYAYPSTLPVIPPWVRTTVDKARPGGISLDMGTDCYPHISYYEQQNGDLRYYSESGAGEQIETVSPNHGDVDGYSSLVLDKQGWPHISFYDDLSTGYLGYAYKAYGVFLPLVMR